jgi:hypothetical protein
MNSRSLQTLYVCLVALSTFVPCRLAAADPITLAWDPPTNGAAGYILYAGTQSGDYSLQFDVGDVTTFTFPDAVAGQRYCFAVTAYTDAGNESPTSGEVCGFSNGSPILTNPGHVFSALGQETSFQISGSDPEGWPLTYDASGLPEGLWLVPDAGFITGTATTEGDYSVTITASDGILSSSQAFIWTVGASSSEPPWPSSVSLSAEPIDRWRTDWVRLQWTGAPWDEAWVYRNGEPIAQAANDGSGYTDRIPWASGDYTYVVCDANAETCSNQVTVTF